MPRILGIVLLARIDGEYVDVLVSDHSLYAKAGRAAG